MRNLEVKSSNLRLAQLRYYELERHASEILDNKAFAVILEVNTFNKDEDGNYIYNYINVFNPLETLPVFDRTPYTNVTPDGLCEFGNKLELKSGEEKDGPCLILETGNLGDDLRKEKVTINDIKNYVLKSKLFFVDRVELLEKDRRLLRDNKYYKRLYLEDVQRLNKLKEYFASFDKEKEYEKK